MPVRPDTQTATSQWEFNRGLVNARADSDLSSGEMTIAHGVFYKRGSEELHMKAGRTAYSTETLGLPGAGMFYAEFSNTLATNKVFVRAATSLYAGDADLTGTFGTAAIGGLSDAPMGLWGSYANQRYYLQDGASQMQVVQFDDKVVSTGEYLYRQAGMLPPTDTPVVTAVAAGIGSVVLTSATVTRTGTKLFQSPELWVDGDKDTASTVSLLGAGGASTMTASAFTGSGAGTLTNWIISLTYSSAVVAGGAGNVVVSYSLDGGANFTVAETTTAPQSKHEVTIPLFGISQASSSIQVRIHVAKTNEPGQLNVSAFDTRVFAADSSGTGNTLTTGVIYWVTEYSDRFGIESAASPRPAMTGPVTNIAGFQVSLPQTLQNPATTTHFSVYRTVDGGAFPTGTLVSRVSIRSRADTDPWPGTFVPKPYFFDPGPLNLEASTITYGFFQVAGLFYERDLTPPIGTGIVTYQNALVTIPTATPNTIRYSAAGYPDSWPSLNSISMGSERDDTVMGLATLSSQLGVFMRGRGKRVDHLPTPSDPSFSAAPEDFAPDHGLESRNGLAYITPPGGNSTHIAYVAKDGIRVTNLYQSTLITNNIDWRATVDTTRLESSYLRALPSESRLEFSFLPTSTFLAQQGWPSSTRCSMWIHYQVYDGQDLAKARITVQPLNYAVTVTVPIEEQDYTFVLSNGLNVPPSKVFVDEVGETDAMLTVDASGTVPRQVQTGVIYPDGEASKLARWRVLRATLDRAPGTDTIAWSLTGFRIDTGDEWTRTLDYENTVGGAKPRTFNVSGQAHQWTVVMDSATGTLPNLRSVGWIAELQGEFV